MKKFSGWANYPRILGTELPFQHEGELRRLASQYETIIPRGMGRSYGDPALSDQMISTKLFNRILEFNKTEGFIICESGTTLEDILNRIVPAGFFLSVLPGTKHISIGGAIAADVHGKNHSTAGSFYRLVENFTIHTADQITRTCSRTNNAYLFWNTFGAMGLTGTILTVQIMLRKIENTYMQVESKKANGLAEIMNCFEDSEEEYNVAWLDTTPTKEALGRGIFSSGSHAKNDELKPAQLSNQYGVHINKHWGVPFNLPSGMLCTSSISFLNFCKWNWSRYETIVVHYDNFFFPLDQIRNWNRVYGKKGFYQFQVVFPIAHADLAIQSILSVMNDRRLPSSLAVLKRFGKSNPHSPMSFPLTGYSLALDFQRTKRSAQLMSELHQITDQHQGRIYLAKDSTMPRATFGQGYPKLDAFKRYLSKLDPDHKYKSMQAVRLGIT